MLCNTYAVLALAQFKISVMYVTGALKPLDLISTLSLRELTDRKWHVQGACATNGEGIYESLDQLSGMVKDFKKNRRY